MDILEALADGTRSVAAIARAAQLPKSTVQRLLMTLEGRGMVSRTDRAEEWCLGARMLYLGLQARRGNGLHDVALPYLHHLRDRFGETVNLNLRVGDERVCIASVEGAHSVRMTGVLGQRSPLHSGAAARAILAFLPEAEIEAYLARVHLEPIASHTITDPGMLRTVLAETRDRGYAFSVSERTSGVTSAGAPIWNELGEVVASINVSGPNDRLQSAPPEALSAAVREAGQAISAAMGYLPAAVRQPTHTGVVNGHRGL